MEAKIEENGIIYVCKWVVKVYLSNSAHLSKYWKLFDSLKHSLLWKEFEKTDSTILEKKSTVSAVGRKLAYNSLAYLSI